MKNSSKFTLFVVSVLLISYGLYKWKVNPSVASPDAPISNEAIDDQESHVEAPIAAASEDSEALPTPSSTQPVDQDLIQSKFAAGLKALGTCFNLSGDPGQMLEPTFQNFNAFVRADMGEAISTSDLWVNTDILLANGEKRRIWIDIDYESGQKVTKSLRYFTVTNAGGTTPIPLSKEQSADATDTFIASLESDGKIISRSRSVTVYYPEFVEMQFVEKDSRLVSFEVLMGESGKFTCTNMNNNDISCKCHD